MDSGGTQADKSAAAKTAAGSTPFDLVMVSIPKSELIQLKADRNSYKSLSERLQKKNGKLLAFIEKLKALVRDLRHRYFKRGSEKKSAKQDKQAVTGQPQRRPRGQVKGTNGHGHRKRPDLPVQEEVLDLSPTQKSCGICEGKLKAGPDKVTWILEARLVLFLRKIVRRSYRECRCQTAAAKEQVPPPPQSEPVTGNPPVTTGPPGMENVAAPDLESGPVKECTSGAAADLTAIEHAPVHGEIPAKKARLIAPQAPGRLIPKSNLGVSIWVKILLAKYRYSNPTNRLLQEWSDEGLALAPGTIAGGTEHLVPLFEPVLGAFKKKQMTEQLFNADETYWKVFEKIAEKVGYRWYLWTFISSSVCFYILDPSRSARVPLSHFGELLHEAVLLVDRYSAYKKLPKTLSILLAFCWAHARRDWVELARNYPHLEQFALGWVGRISTLYHLNKQRLKAAEQDFAARDSELRKHVQLMADQWAQDLANSQMHPAARKCLESLERHWEGLTRFVDHCEIAMDNNRAERMVRGPVVGRKGFYGSGSVQSAQLAAQMFTVIMTLVHCWKINPQHWLTEYLNTCADNDGHPPQDLSEFLPWQLTAERLAQLRKPLPYEPLNLNTS